ncbi:DUF4823 domain-containing protein [Serratia odorifera]|jgi:hypothetical protein|uniref:DUF4823 domain-containing protein n=2 Tax=Serratia odorifera TaxID=618 RepID=D4E534_SEROD|nr:DUF4823 domain-containing protein [Serratia odorifera]EFE95230.1 hypothetical protein HMPREF0758_3284 [Serratia odorifera DSM 4582]PNK89833.1 DUF4823 domain-containing protein [Serratia odorifera]RII70583.1 DUF4823 domain-containing protein [Serratia odorifera]VDZ61916.1 Uncharacterised protein [Serratia odorifera]
MFSKSFLALLAISLTGCSAKYSENVLDKAEVRLVKDTVIIIAEPTPGFYGSIQYPDSGRMTADAVKTAFSHYSDKVSVTANCSSLSCLTQSKASLNGYYVVPEILHWEDRATEWSGIPDKLDIKLTLYDGLSQKRIASTILSGKSKWMTFGGDHPQDLLAEPINNYVNSLYK